MAYEEIARDICWLQSGYTGTKEVYDMYLGDQDENYIAVKPKVKLQAHFDTEEECRTVIDWWDKEGRHGRDTFIISAKLFASETRLTGEQESFGVRQITPLIHTVNKNIHKLSFTVEIVFDSDSVDNTTPVATELTVYVQQDSENNFIKLGGEDADNDILKYAVTTLPTLGELTGEAPNLLYTPAKGVGGLTTGGGGGNYTTDDVREIGDGNGNINIPTIPQPTRDSFTFTASDNWSTSEPTTVYIEIGTKEHADFSVSYKTTAPIRVVGNFHYDLGDGNIHIGQAGKLTSLDDDGVITIWSDDHIIDERDRKFIDFVSINHWGIRTNYKHFLKDFTALDDFTVTKANDLVAETGIACQGRNFAGFYWNCGLLYTPMFFTGKGINFEDMFRGSQIQSFPRYDLRNGIYFMRMLKDANIINTPFMDTKNGEFFQDFASGATRWECMSGMDTKKNFNTIGMFDMTPSLDEQDPSGAIRNKLRTGCNAAGAPDDEFNGCRYSNPVACRFDVTVTQVTSKISCDIDVIDGSCTSEGQYHAVASGEPSAVTAYTWYVSTNAVISAGQGTDTVTISNTSTTDTRITVRCAITAGKTEISEPFLSTHYHKFTGLELTIPKQASHFYLSSFISANNPQGKTEIIIYNKIINGPCISGTLTGLNVKLINTGEFQGKHAGAKDPTSVANNGLTLTSPLQLINKTGKIKGCGGYGGQGGQGKDNAYTYYDYYEHYDYGDGCQKLKYGCFTFKHGNGVPETRMYYGGKYRQYQAINENWMTMDGYDSAINRFRRKGYERIIYCSYKTWVWGIERRMKRSGNRVGGLGGHGGYGASYGQSDVYANSWRSPQDGKGSKPSGGHSGGDGGNGGYWGAEGYRGDRGDGKGDYGDYGFKAGKGIQGIGFLKTGSVTGAVYGDKI